MSDPTPADAHRILKSLGRVIHSMLIGGGAHSHSPPKIETSTTIML